MLCKKWSLQSSLLKQYTYIHVENNAGFFVYEAMLEKMCFNAFRLLQAIQTDLILRLDAWAYIE